MIGEARKRNMPYERSGWQGGLTVMGSIPGLGYVYLVENWVLNT